MVTKNAVSFATKRNNDAECNNVGNVGKFNLK